jgi:hypothetical protein
MSDVEQRLLRAARELRELDLAPPPLPGIALPTRTPTSRVPALVVPALVLLGGLAVMAGALGRDVGTDPVAEQAIAVVVTSAAPTPVDAVVHPPIEGEPVGDPAGRAAPAVRPVRVLTAHEEVVMIGSLAPSRLPAAAEPVTVTSLRRF